MMDKLHVGECYWNEAETEFNSGELFFIMQLEIRPIATFLN